jgi:hypothetical protein
VHITTFRCIVRAALNVRMAVTNELERMWKEAIVLIFCLMDHQNTPKHDLSRIEPGLNTLAGR